MLSIRYAISVSVSEEVGSSRMRTLGSVEMALRNSRICCSPLTRRLTGIRGSSEMLKALEKVCGFLVKPPPPDRVQRADGLTVGEYVLRDGEASHQGELLEHHPDARAHGLVGRGERHFLPVQQDPPAVRAARRLPGSGSACSCPPRSPRSGRGSPPCAARS